MNQQQLEYVMKLRSQGHSHMPLSQVASFAGVSADDVHYAVRRKLLTVQRSSIEDIRFETVLIKDAIAFAEASCSQGKQHL